jgi:ATP synthase protein I
MSVDPTDQQQSQDASAYAMALGLGAELLGSLAVCAIPGWLLDKKLGTGPWLTLLGALLGIALGLFQLIRTATRRQNGGPKRR